jgi:Ala-tRNA(Pro) deacylase
MALMVADRARHFLEEHAVHFEVIPHREAYTAQGVAAASHVSGWSLAKVLIVREHGESPFMVVLPASCRLDLLVLGRLLGKEHLELVPEVEIGRLFPDCETGAMPPFGHLYGLPVYVDGCFKKDGFLAFQAGNHRETLRIRYTDYEKLVQPAVAEFCRD